MIRFDHEPHIAVGLLTDDAVAITFHRGYAISGRHTFTPSDAPASFVAEDPDACFTVEGVVIGIGFHWEQRIDLKFSGNCRIVRDGDRVTVINDVNIDDYIKSVISSEMAATASPQLLRAHAVISRSWALAQVMPKQGHVAADSCCPAAVARDESGERVERWYDREDHRLFDVCADDHCQRYQGVTRITTPAVAEAVDATRGLVLADSAGNLCDARFSKCCGGVTERFSACWQPIDFHYLAPVRDCDADTDMPDLTDEAGASQWIMSRPKAWCDCSDPAILSQVLNNFDLVTRDFYRWEVSYNGEELSQLIRCRSGIDFGRILALEPIERGASGRIISLRIVGTRRTVVVGKELEIRRWLSQSHLYSSAFIVEHDNALDRWTLRGAGWGHGVGLCQIGAAVMASEGIDYRTILAHYYPGSSLIPAWR